METTKVYDRAADRACKGAISLDLGVACYNRGMETHDVEDFEHARRWYEASAAFGNMQAIVNLGYIWYHGRTGRKDPRMAYELFEKAAREGHAEACYKLGDMYAAGEVCAKSDARAFELYTRAYDLGADEEACVAGSAAYRLGKCYETGIGCDASAGEALHYYRNAVVYLGEAIECGYGYYAGTLLACRAAVKRLGGMRTADPFDSMKLTSHVALYPLNGTTVQVDRAVDGGASIIFGDGAGRTVVAKHLDAGEFAEFAHEVAGMRIYDWRASYAPHPRYAVLDGYTWNMEVVRDGRSYTSQGVNAHPFALEQLYALLEQHGVPKVWDEEEEGPYAYCAVP